MTLQAGFPPWLEFPFISRAEEANLAFLLINIQAINLLVKIYHIVLLRNSWQSTNTCPEGSSAACKFQCKV